MIALEPLHSPNLITNVQVDRLPLISLHKNTKYCSVIKIDHFFLSSALIQEKLLSALTKGKSEIDSLKESDILGLVKQRRPSVSIASLEKYDDWESERAT